MRRSTKFHQNLPGSTSFDVDVEAAESSKDVTHSIKFIGSSFVSCKFANVKSYFRTENISNDFNAKFLFN
jgi:hypothetical protein